MPDLRPLYPYAGGKRSHLHNITPYLQHTETYVEPFFGGGAAFCFMYNYGRASKFIINDIRKEIIDIYLEIQANPHEVTKEFMELRSAWIAASLSKKETLYYETRDGWLKTRGAAKKLLLMNTNFGGLYQVSSSTKIYNASSGHSKRTGNVGISTDVDLINQWHEALQQTDIYYGDFEQVPIQENSIVFADPPYYMAQIDYDSGFAVNDQIRCFNWCDRCASRANVSVIMTNSDAEGFFRNLCVEKNVAISFYGAIYTAGEYAVKGEEIVVVWNRKKSSLVL